ncbi:MAG: hypothetical protein LBM87_05015 [Ruminococcus sp.]|jgi:hypothetical protein|nr:hypothetical protein [Ruminococcus sp.]
MKISKFLKDELRFLIPRYVILTSLSFLISGILWRFDRGFLFGLILAAAAVLCETCLSAVFVERATQRRQIKSAKRIIRLSYILRMFLLCGTFILAIVLPFINEYAFFVAPIFTYLIYTFEGIIGTVKEHRAEKAAKNL